AASTSVPSLASFIVFLPLSRIPLVAEDRLPAATAMSSIASKRTLLNNMYDVNRLFRPTQLEDGTHLLGQRLAERLVVFRLHVAAIHAGLRHAVGVVVEAAGPVRDLLEVIGVVYAFLPGFAPHGGFGNVGDRGWRDDQDLRA